MGLMPPNLTLKDGAKFCYVYFTTILRKLKETVYHRVKVSEFLLLRPAQTTPCLLALICFLGSILQP